MENEKFKIIVVSQPRLKVMSYSDELTAGSERNPNGTPIYLISIVGKWSMPRDFGEFPEGSKMLMLEFEDIVEGNGKMLDSDAEAIWGFVEEAVEKKALIIVHCLEGVSRSAAVGIAIAEMYPNCTLDFLEYGVYNIDGAEVKADKNFGQNHQMHPNRHVLNLMRMYA